MAESMSPTPPEAPAGGQTTQQRNMMIAVIVGVVLLCCCCLGLVVAYVGWTYGDQILEELGRSLPVLLAI